MTNNPEYIKELNRTIDLIEETPTYYFYNKLNEETGEVAEVAAAFMGSLTKEKKLLKKHTFLEDALLEELGDTFNVLCIIGARHNLTVDQIIDMGREKMKRKNDKRS